MEELRCRGLTRAATNYWEQALRKLEKVAFVNPTLDHVDEIWHRCARDQPVVVSIGQFEGPLTASGIFEMRRTSVQRFLDRAVQTAEQGYPLATRQHLERFRQELELANATATRFGLNDFRVNGAPATQDTLERLIKSARRETGFLGWFRALWRRWRKPPLPPAGWIQTEAECEPQDVSVPSSRNSAMTGTTSD
jgi:hypothetical protein